MTCACGSAIPEGKRFCADCGAAAPEPAAHPILLPAESVENDSGTKKVTIALVLLAIGMVGMALIDRRPGSPPVVKAEAGISSGPATVKFDCYCGESELSTMEAYAAVKREDFQAIAGLISRRKIFALAAKDKVVVSFISGSLSRVRVTSGFRVGERCWIPSGLLED